jgi:hypothetical protein
MTSVFLDFVRVVVDGDFDQVSRRVAGSPALVIRSAILRAPFADEFLEQWEARSEAMRREIPHVTPPN